MNSELPSTNRVVLREILDSDLDVFFEHQKDPAAVHMAAFTADHPNDRVAFNEHWHKVRISEAITKMTIVCDGQVVGHILAYELFTKPELSYWVGREFWSKGIGTSALGTFLEIVQIRPLYARAASDNKGSIRVLEKCGFVLESSFRGFANARAAEIDEVLMRLD